MQQAAWLLGLVVSQDRKVIQGDGGDCWQEKKKKTGKKNWLQGFLANQKPERVVPMLAQGHVIDLMLNW